VRSALLPSPNSLWIVDEENDMNRTDETYLVNSNLPFQADDAVMAALEQVADHDNACQCAACRQLTQDVTVDYLLGHPRWAAIARRFVERRFPF
jgi:hypothetical protein